MGVMYETAAALLMGAMLIPCAVSDVKHQCISLRLTAVSGLAAVFYTTGMLWLGELAVSDVFLSLMPGVFLLLTSLVTGGRIGAGDGLIFLAVGLLAGYQGAFLILFAALMFSAVWSSLLLVRRKAGRGSTIPWMPFVLAGYLVWAVCFVLTDWL